MRFYLTNWQPVTNIQPFNKIILLFQYLYSIFDALYDNVL